MASCRTNSCGPIKYPAQQLGIKSDCEVQASASGQDYYLDSTHVIRGVQSFGYDSNLEITPNFQLGQGQIYEINEGIPEIDITVSKAIDGYCTPYLAATKDARKPTLLGRAPQFSTIALSIFPCDVDSATDTPNSTVVFPDVQVNSVSYSFTTDGAFTEDTSFRGNNVIWYNPSGNNSHNTPCVSGGCTPSARFLSDVAAIQFNGFNSANNQRPNPKTQFKEDLVFAYDSASLLDINCMVCDPDATILPPEVYGISPSGTNDDDICISSISVSADFAREDINCLGSRGPKNRTLTLPVAVNTTIEVISERGDNFSATEYGVCVNTVYSGLADVNCSDVGTNAPTRTIRIATCDGLRVYLGTGNKITGVSHQGGGTDGGDVSVTYNFQTFNALTVMHLNDCAPSGTAWWTNRDVYLCDPA